MATQRLARDDSLLPRVLHRLTEIINDGESSKEDRQPTAATALLTAVLEEEGAALSPHRPELYASLLMRLGSAADATESKDAGYHARSALAAFLRTLPPAAPPPPEPDALVDDDDGNGGSVRILRPPPTPPKSAGGGGAAPRTNGRRVSTATTTRRRWTLMRSSPRRRPPPDGVAMARALGARSAAEAGCTPARP